MIMTNTSDFSSEISLRFQAVWSSFGVPPRLEHASLDNYRPTCAEQERALQKCRSYAANGLENIARGHGLFLQGPVGTGKSHLVASVLRAMLVNNTGCFGKPPGRFNFVGEPVYTGYYCSMVSVIDLLGQLRESFSSDRMRLAAQQLMHRCRTNAVVVLDDIGAEKPTDWVEEQLYALIDLRYRMQRSTFFTTNCTMKELEVQIGSRSFSRIFEMCEGVRVGGEDWRKRGI